MATETAPSKKPKLGEILVKYGIITQNMLKNALRRQSQVGGQIGSVLIEMGYITTDTLLDFLSKQFGVPAVNLFKLDIPSDMLKALPIEKIKEYKVLPLEIDNKLTLAMVNPKDYIAIRDVEFILGKRVNTVVVPSLQFNAAIKSIETTGMGSFKGCEIEQSCEIVHNEGTSDMNTLLHQMMETQATDLQLTAGVPPSLKMSSELRRVNITFEKVAGAVIIPSGSCAAMIRHSYPELFAGDNHWLPRAASLAERTYELSEYLVDVLGVTDLGASYPGNITYHSSCHLLRELGVNRQPRARLDAVRDLHFSELPQGEECCGFGGVFSVEHPEISAAMLQRKISNIETSGVPTVVSCDAGCITHFNGGLHRQGKTKRAVHIAEILAGSLHG